jgi:translation initiation factor 2B subunit (eIF-2B alpha/beta/delta family)
MNNTTEIPKDEIQFFKEKVTRWLHVDNQISELANQMKELKKVRDKELQPNITTFMVQHNVSDLNTDNGKLRCHERKTKKGLNKHNIRSNLSKFLEEQDKLDEAMDTILTKREVIVKHVLKKVK